MRGSAIAEPSSQAPRPAPAWGAVMLGAMGALGLGLVLFILLGVFGVLDSAGGRALLVLVQYTGLFVAGYLAGRFSGRNEALNGGLSGLLVFVLAAVISMAGGAELGVVLIVILGVVAVVIGTAGGVLAAARRR